MQEIKLTPKGKFFFDKFNNLIIFGGDKNDIKECYDFCTNEPSLKTASILLYGDKDETQDTSFTKCIYVGEIKDEFIKVGNRNLPKGTKVHIYVIPNKTLIPQTILVNGEPTIQSGHTLALFVGHDNKQYFLCVHDPSKPVLILPGGTMSSDDNGNRNRTAIRKFHSDTTLTNEIKDLKSFCEMTFHNTLFGISKIPDVAEFFVTRINNPFTDDEFNKTEGCYVRPISTLKTDLLMGLPFDACVASDFDDLKKDSSLSNKQWQKNQLSRILNCVLFGFKKNENKVYSSDDLSQLGLLFTPTFSFKSI